MRWLDCSRRIIVGHFRSFCFNYFRLTGCIVGTIFGQWNGNHNIRIWSGWKSYPSFLITCQHFETLSCKSKGKKTALVKRTRSDGQNGPHQPECLTSPAQKIWWCFCRPDCLAHNASLQVQQHNSKPSFLTAVVTALFVAGRQPLFQFTL